MEGVFPRMFLLNGFGEGIRMMALYLFQAIDYWVALVPSTVLALWDKIVQDPLYMFEYVTGS
jgi:hypothetical protein